MLTDDEVRRAALALGGVVEADHHGFPSFRVAGRIFAALPSEGVLRVVLDEPGTRTAAAADPDVCHEVFWGRRLASAEVDLLRAEAPLVRDLPTDAWEHQRSRGGRAPGRRPSAGHQPQEPPAADGSRRSQTRGDGARTGWQGTASKGRRRCSGASTPVQRRCAQPR